MYVIREVVHCRPGKVRQMVGKFNVISATMREMGREPIRLLTDVSGANFWTLIAEIHAERLDDFFAMEKQLMANENLRQVMADYHDLVDSGRREVYRIES